MNSSRHALSRRLFLHALGIVFVIAFASLRVQQDGLIGGRGVWSAAETIEALRPLGFTQAPTLFFFTGASDSMLHFACNAGLLFSSLLALGLYPLPLLALCWALYLSLTIAGSVFMGFQWESLLLESGLTALFFCADHPLTPLWRNRHEPPRLARYLQLWLLIRLMFLSGLVKLTSGDSTWRTLAALDVHYFTQPLPGPLSWSVHQLASLHRPATLTMFAIELGAPILLLIPCRLRRAGALALIVLQLCIFATGNYGFFNLLSLALCVPALDDALLEKVLPFRLAHRLGDNVTQASAGRARATRSFCVLGALVIIPVSSVEALSRVAPRLPVPAFLESLSSAVSPLRSINSYGLFAVMTTERDEIVLEGSRDGKEWRDYRFGYKPGALDENPSQVAPHQPRLDWQMWFAALGSYRRNPWYLEFLQRLLEGEPGVLGLLRDNPFPEGPPRYLRSRFFRYRFSTPEERRSDHHVWERDELAPYAPTVTLENGRLAAARLPDVIP